MSTLLCAWLAVMAKHDGVELIVDLEEKVGLAMEGRVVCRAPWNICAAAWASEDDGSIEVASESRRRPAFIRESRPRRRARWCSRRCGS